MTAPLFAILNIVSLGILAGTGLGLVIAYIGGIARRDWSLMETKDKRTTALLVLACSATFVAVQAWYVFQYSAV